MNFKALTRAGLSLRIIPPRAGSELFAVPSDYEDVLAAIQKLRGSVYVADGALPPSAIEPDGRHRSELDEISYHLTLWNGEVQGCARITFYAYGYSAEKYKAFDLIRRMPVEQAEIYSLAFNSCLTDWQSKGFRLGEIGGWAISNLYRMNSATAMIPFAGWSLARMKKKQVWIASATERNGSAQMLLRLGGWRLKHEGKELPSFFDTAYRCNMEFIGFDSETLNPKFEEPVKEIENLLRKHN